MATDNRTSTAPRSRFAFLTACAMAGRGIVALLCLAVGLGFTLYFWHREGLLPLPQIFGNTDRMSFPVVLRSLLLPWHIWWSNIPWGWLVYCFAAIGYFLVLGWLILGCFRQRFPWFTEIFLSIAFGMGTAGVAFELLGMAGWLGRAPVIFVGVVLVGVAFFVRYIVAEKPMNPPVDALPPPERKTVGASVDRMLWWLLWIMTTLICALMLLHGVAYPETYWDSLILYMGYARKMFLQECFPFKAVGQVGIGLGANYPHLAAVLFASTAKVAGQWNDLVCQVLPPVLSWGWIVFIYGMVRAMTDDRLVAAATALLVRSIPYGLCYSQFASDYSFAVFYTAAFLYVGCLYVRSARPALLVIAMLLAAFAMHVNYLMGVLWLAGLALIFFAHFGYFDDRRAGVLSVFTSKKFWMAFSIAVGLALPWYIRNLILTGNPVYAFFSNIFGGVRINPDVMQSAVVEWKLNGDGLYTVGTTLTAKLCGSWFYFVTGPHHWKLQPVLFGFVLPGIVLWLCCYLRRTSRRSVVARFGAVSFVLFLMLAAYAYCIADYYLYQIIIILPLFGVFAAFSLKQARRWFVPVALMVGFAPGLIMGLMGFKLKSTGMIGSEPYGQHVLTALRNPFMDRALFMRMAYEGDMEMFDKLKQLPDNSVLLTHENRHLLLEERTGIVHLDDWEPQSVYGKSPQERLAVLDNLGVNYYLYVPNEDKHRANARLGMDELIGLGYFTKEWETPAQGVNEREGLDYKNIPTGKNVLYKRVKPEN